MRQLRFVGFGDDGKSVVVMDATGEQFELAIDEQFKAAARGDALKLGQMEIRTPSTLRPAEIQARVRAGESVEDVASAAGVPVERVLPFARPVLLERGLIAEQAMLAHCRPWSSGQTPQLGELVATRLTQYGYDPEDVEWDAARRDNGTWRVSIRYGSGTRAAEAVWVYDPIGRQVKANDNTAQSLTGEPTGTPETGGVLSSRPGRAPREPARPLSVVGSSRRAAEDEAGDADVPADTIELDEEPARPARRPAAKRTQEKPSESEALTLDEPVHEQAEAGTDSADAEDEPADPPKRAHKRSAKSRSSKQGSVPAWEDILLGVRDSRNA